MKTFVTTVAVFALGLSGCGGSSTKSSSINPNTASCSQLAAGTKTHDDVAAALAKQVPGGANNPSIQGEIAADIDLVCANGSSFPARDAMAAYQKAHPAVSTTP